MGNMDLYLKRQLGISDLRVGGRSRTRTLLLCTNLECWISGWEGGVSQGYLPVSTERQFGMWDLRMGGRSRGQDISLLLQIASFSSWDLRMGGRSRARTFPWVVCWLRPILPPCLQPQHVSQNGRMSENMLYIYSLILIW